MKAHGRNGLPPGPAEHRDPEDAGGLIACSGSPYSLAARTQPGAALGDDLADDRSSTTRTGQTFATVDLEEILVLAALAVGVDIIRHGCAATQDRAEQDPLRRVEQSAPLSRRQARCRADRVEPRFPQDLVGVQVADASQKALVE